MFAFMFSFSYLYTEMHLGKLNYVALMLYLYFSYVRNYILIYTNDKYFVRPYCTTPGLRSEERTGKDLTGPYGDAQCRWERQVMPSLAHNSGTVFAFTYYFFFLPVTVRATV